MVKIPRFLWKTRSGRFLLFTLLFTRGVFILAYRSKKYAKPEIPCIFVLRETQCFTTNQWHTKQISRISANFTAEIKEKRRWNKSASFGGEGEIRTLEKNAVFLRAASVFNFTVHFAVHRFR
jgi:hypothetical protein